MVKLTGDGQIAATGRRGETKGRPVTTQISGGVETWEGFLLPDRASLNGEWQCPPENVIEYVGDYRSSARKFKLLW